MDLFTDLAFGLVFVICTVALSLVTYLISRRVIGGDVRQHHKDMANAMVTRIGALHALILALVFAQEMAAYQRLEGQTATEASAIADVYNDARRYDAVALQPLRDAMTRYLGIVIDREWEALGSGRGLDDEAWTEWGRAYDIVLDLQPSTLRQTSLRDRMLVSLHVISASRDMREAEANTSIASFFWIAAISGVMLIAIGHYIHPPERQNLILLALFSAYTGAILFLIFGFSNPYAPPAELGPGPMYTLAQDIREGVEA